MKSGRLIMFIKDLLRDPDRKPLLRIFIELIYLTFVFKTLPKHYFSRYLFKKGRNNIRDYFPIQVLYNIKPLFNNKDVQEVLENKLFFDFYYSQFGISLPKILMYNFKNVFITGGNKREVNNIDDFTDCLNELFVIYPETESIIIKKTSWSYGGVNIYKLFKQEARDKESQVKQIYSEVIKSGFLFQATVKQHPELNKLNPSSLNTIRCDTFINRDGTVELISAYLRMSISNHHVDNIGAGGCMVGIDLETGKLMDEGYSSIKTSGVRLFYEHPVTKTKFAGFTIPLFNEVKELLIKTAAFMPELRLVGWDVGIGESGPVLIEGNSDYSLAGNDLISGGYRSNPVFRKVLKEINYL